MINCTLCNKSEIKEIYIQKNIPLFQNVIYKNQEDAINAKKSNVNLFQCLNCGFVFNKSFSSEQLNYNRTYQNEQANSIIFQKHLSEVYNILEPYIYSKIILEIGCGKGYFLELLSKKGHNIIGFDPCYEGNNPNIIKEYYSSRNAINVDVILLRHTLEHIFYPYSFIKNLSYLNKQPLIFIEIPSFNWILENNAIEDIYYEHCNYFPFETLQNIFHQKISGIFFGGQYIYVLAELNSLLDQNSICRNNIENLSPLFRNKIREYTDLINNSSNIALWGAGAKGCTFANLFDPLNKKIKCLIDINPYKQNKYLGGTGHLIISPDKLSELEIDTIIVMNKNYFNEINDIINNTQIKLINL